MADETELTPDAIAQAATGPARATADGQSADAVPIPDQIKAAQFQASAKTAGKKNRSGGRRSPWRGVVSGRAVPPGAT